METAEAIVRRVADSAIRLAITRWDLESSHVRSQDEIVSDIIAVLLGEDTGCLDPDDLDETNCELLFVRKALRERPAALAGETRQEAEHWKANHDEQVRRKHVAQKLLLEEKELHQLEIKLHKETMDYLGEANGQLEAVITAIGVPDPDREGVTPERVALAQSRIAQLEQTVKRFQSERLIDNGLIKSLANQVTEKSAALSQAQAEIKELRALPSQPTAPQP